MSAPDFFILAIILFILFIPLCFLPTIIAYKRKSIHKGYIFILNLLTGGTGIGWVASFIWACIDDTEP
jgi:hypothetical protein